MAPRSTDRLPTVVATDLDGTLLRSDRTVSDRTRAALDAVVAAGVRLVFITGRPPRWLPPVVEATGHAGLAVCANGALVVDLADGRVVRERAMEAATGRRVVTALTDAVPGLTFGAEHADGFSHTTTFAEATQREPHPDGVLVDHTDDLFARPVTKLLVRGAQRGSDALADRVEPLVADDVHVTFSGDGLLEVSAHGVTKATTLAALVADDGLGAGDVVAFGDMPNDVAMLQWAGTGVAVATAHPAVLEVADEVTAGNDDDGVGRWLEAALAGRG